MTRLAISVEGQTEKEFFNRLVAPHLHSFDISAIPIIVTTKRVLDGPNHKGGDISIQRVLNQVRPLLHSFDYVSTFYDFYAFKGIEKNETAINLAATISQKLENPRNFIAYVQQYEFESLLFSDCEAIGNQFDSADLSSTLLAAVAEKGDPEKVNDSYATCPSRRIESACKTHTKQNYDKVFHGPMIAEKIGLEKIRAACPLFSNWLTKLEAM